MITALCILAYLFIGWIVASACLTLSIRNNLKRTPEDGYTDFVVPFFFWWLVLIRFFIYYTVNIALWLGRKMEILITKTKEKTMETINDIVAEMRDLAAHRDWHNHTNLSNRERMLDFADRIEKAVKFLEADRDNRRKQALAEDERANATQPVTNCNGFKMRETVAETEKSIDKAISILEQIPETCGFAGILEDACDVLCDLKEEFVKPALSAPPRNCDLHTTDAEASKAFIAWYNTTYGLNADVQNEVSSCDLKHNLNGILHNYIEWLFAEAKGETK